ncbi:hypothetical protein SPSIL_057880 [Sporomusa silvacetica DSM 10669]|uniref:HTH asnC-type domain-containing protein n=1 Tax=Sporomusa silvacetica DSM 10669 TaxID=1123289 RepID=A0ABZ3IVT4_9FIRM|nr:Lrp/AsnC family transcriptional regulator [Sporomusa silvacetica]OZC14264.1 HTH-type transcriptional regulator LrpC [Sporomusa silvacetica DSM 10669]
MKKHLNAGPLRELDEIDRQICSILSTDSRTSYSDIARQVHLSRMSVRERITNLQKNGIIERFTIRINARKTGAPLAVFLLIKADSRKVESVAEAVAKHPKVDSIYATTGTNALHVHAFLCDSQEMEDFIHKDLYTIDGVIEIQSNIMIKRYKSDRLLLV